ncbi:MAG: GNAT family N-acetyltransferase [Planctomycetaceae bacterium]
MLIERAAPEDAESMAALWRRSVDATHLHFISAAELDALAPVVGDYLRNERTAFWVVRDGDKLAGFMGLNGSKIESLFLSPGHFRQGIGRQLIQHALGLSSELLVDVNEQNATAIAFYEACGFVVTGRSDLDAQGNAHPLVHMQHLLRTTVKDVWKRRDVSQTPDLRTDILTGRQCIVAPERASRPSAFTIDPPLVRLDANGQPDDPFAEGNEQETPGERFAIRDAGSAPNARGWKLRVVPNRYPAVTAETSENDSALEPTGRASDDFQFFPAQSAIGEHDVVIECPDSRSRWSELTREEMICVFAAWRTRLRQLTSSGKYRSISVFRNEGFSAGASLSHCHSQIIAHRELTPLDRIRHQRQHEFRTARRISEGQETDHRVSTDLAGALLDAELHQRVRIVQTTSRFVALCPFASRSAYHVRIVPRDGVSWAYCEVSDEDLAELTDLVRHVVNAWSAVLGNCPSFNMLLPHSRLDQPAEFRWMLELIPRTGRIAGLELLSDLDLVTVSPEAAATSLADSSVR